MRNPCKKFMSIDFDVLESVLEAFPEDEVKDLLLAAVKYDLTGNKVKVDPKHNFAYLLMCKNIDVYTEKAIAKVKGGTKGANKRWGKDKSAGMTEAEMDAEIDAMFPKTNQK